MINFGLGFIAGVLTFWAITTAPVREAIVREGKATAQQIRENVK